MVIYIIWDVWNKMKMKRNCCELEYINICTMNGCNNWHMMPMEYLHPIKEEDYALPLPSSYSLDNPFLGGIQPQTDISPTNQLNIYQMSRIPRQSGVP